MPEDRSPCRDFERGVCSRGDNCKYYHPESAASAESAKSPICKDYQNKGCGRMKCKFLHITPEEEADYNNTGILPEHHGHPEKSSNPSFMGKDVCKDFLNGICDRGPRCKFMHISERELHANNASMGGMYGKRHRSEDDFYGGAHRNDAAIVDENESLRHKIAELQKDALALRQMNDTLYDQNARYRSQLFNSNTTTASEVNAYNQQVVYPQYSQAAYPPKSATVPTASTTSDTSAYIYQQY